MTTESTSAPAAPRPEGSASSAGLGPLPERALMASLQSLKVVLGVDSPEVRGWAPVVQQGAQATVNAAIAEIKRLSAMVESINPWIDPKPGELPRRAIQCFGCEGFPSGNNDPCDVCGRSARRA